MPNLLYILDIYIYIYDLVGFYGILTFVDYLMPNPLYTYILNINTCISNMYMICKHFGDNIFKAP